jgi:uncharacterized membrane protein YhaH (DUF805 family)
VAAGSGGWAVAATVAVAAAAGVLLIDDETAQLVFLIGLAALLVIGGGLAERRQADRGRPDWTFVIPLLVAFGVSRLFGSDDARLAALFVLAVVFAFAWQQVLARWISPRHP